MQQLDIGMQFSGSDILSVDQFELSDVERVFSLARQMEPIVRGTVRSSTLAGYILGNLFYEPSTRTRMSFASAFMRLGGQVNSSIGMPNSSMAKGETLSDTIRVIQSYCDVLVIRHPQPGAAAEAAAVSQIPVINAGDGTGEHPTQALQDLYTIRAELGHRRLTIAVVGDLRFGRCPHSLIKLLALYPDVTCICVAPAPLQISSTIIDEVQGLGMHLKQSTDLASGLQDADVIYWTRIQDERIEDKESVADFRHQYVLNRDAINRLCKPGVTIMHPLPRVNELSPDLDTLPNAAYFRQAANSMPIRMALLLLVLGKDQAFGDSRSTAG
jgi:aspartate carbamoyltransferase catalytic subunit